MSMPTTLPPPAEPMAQLPPAPVEPEPKWGKVKKLKEEKRIQLAEELDAQIKLGITAWKSTKDEFFTVDKYWMGDHWDDKDPEWMPKPVENWVFATIEQHSSNLATANVVPIIVGQDPGDDEVAEKFNLVCQFLSLPNKLNVRRVVRRSIHSAMKLGTGMVKVYFDNNVNGGRMLPPDKPLNMVNPLDNTPFVVTHTAWKGEVAIELVDMSNVIPDPAGYALEGPGACEWIAIRQPRSRQWVENNPQFQKYLGKDALTKLLGEIGDTPTNKSETEFYHGRTVNNTHKSSKEFMVDEIWKRRMDEFGNWHIDLYYKIGCHLLWYVEDVYRDGQFPFAILYDHEVDKSFFGMGEAKNVIPNNKTINQVNRLAALNAMHMTNTQKVVTTDSGIDPNEVAQYGTMPGAVWRSRTTDGIKSLEVNEIPVSVFKVAESAREGIRTIMAMDEANMGQFGGSVTAASGIKMIQDKANVRDQDKGYNIEDFVSRLYMLVISRVQQFYDTERYIPILGEDAGPNRFVPFKGIDYQDINLVVRVEAGSGTPLNKASIAQRAWDMFIQQATSKFDPPLITVEELLDTLDGFPMAQTMKRRIKKALAEQGAMETVQIAQMLLMLGQQTGMDVTQMPPEQLVPVIDQLKAQAQMAQQSAPPQGVPPQPSQVA